MSKAKTVQINTDQESGYKGAGETGQIYVDKDDPWDKYSKIFKKYIHTINYEGAEYIASNYTINVVYRCSVGSGIGFQYKNPSRKVEKVEVFFKGTDKPSSRSAEPLVVRFVYEGGDFVLEGSEDNCKSSNSSECYYTWSSLISIRYQTTTGTISAESFKEKDLITRLLELIGNSIGRENKLVIRLNERPDGRGSVVPGGRNTGEFKYPDSGHYSQGGNRKITVRKVSNTGVPGVEGYEHTVSTSVNASEFYVAYGNDSRYFKVESGVQSGSGSYLYTVTGYFEIGGSRSNKLVLIKFTFRKDSRLGYSDGKLYGYSYHDFVKELKEVKAEKATNTDTAKTIDVKDAIGTLSSELEMKLKHEKERLEPLISFEKVGDVSDDTGYKNVTLKHEDVFTNTNVQGYNFKKVVLEPNTKDEPGGGSSVGPWKLYNNNQLFTLERDLKIQDELLDVIITSVIKRKYRSITVYYTSNDNSNYKALLVEFYTGDGTKIGFKRTNVDRNEWDGESILGSSVDEQKLTQIATHAKIIESSSGSSSSSSGEPHTSNQGGSTDNIAIYAGVGGGLGAAVIAGTGFAIYKYLRK